MALSTLEPGSEPASPRHLLCRVCFWALLCVAKVAHSVHGDCPAVKAEHIMGHLVLTPNLVRNAAPLVHLVRDFRMERKKLKALNNETRGNHPNTGRGEITEKNRSAVDRFRFIAKTRPI